MEVERVNIGPRKEDLSGTVSEDFRTVSQVVVDKIQRFCGWMEHHVRRPHRSLFGRGKASDETTIFFRPPPCSVGRLSREFAKTGNGFVNGLVSLLCRVGLMVHSYVDGSCGCQPLPLQRITGLDVDHDVFVVGRIQVACEAEFDVL